MTTANPRQSTDFNQHHSLHYKRYIHILLNTGLVLLTASFMVGCGHQNELLTVDADQAGHFLVAADSYAEKQLKHPKHEALGDYQNCMQGKIVDQSYCEDLYTAMASYAKTQSVPFNQVSVSDIKNPETWTRLKSYYQAALFNHIPQY